MTSALEHMSSICDPKIHMLERIEIAMPGVSEYLKGIHGLIRQMQAATQDDPLLDALWVARGRILHSVCEFDREELVRPLESLGSQRFVGDRWGLQAARDWSTAHRAGEALAGTRNELRAALMERASRYAAERSKRVKLYCHRGEPNQADLSFLQAQPSWRIGLIHTLAEYRAARPFDVLLKVGPLLGCGRGKLPDAILSAPKFRSLVQFVWHGLHDATDYPLEALATEPLRWMPAQEEGVDQEVLALGSGIVWNRVKTRIGNAEPMEVPLLNEFTWNDVPLPRRNNTDTCDALLVAFRGGFAAFLPPGGKELTYAEENLAGERAGLRNPEDAFWPGLWWARKMVNAQDLGELTAQEGARALQWKLCLGRAVETEPIRLEQQLRERGVQRNDMWDRMQEWRTVNRSVITAPKTRSDFDVLLRLLEPWGKDATMTPVTVQRWIDEAWKEVQASRSVAINTGVVEHELIDEELLRILEARVDRQRLGQNQAIPYRLLMEPSSPLAGHVDLYPVSAIDHGYSCPISKLRQICTLEEAAEWQE